MIRSCLSIIIIIIVIVIVIIIIIIVNDCPYKLCQQVSKVDHQIPHLTLLQYVDKVWACSIILPLCGNPVQQWFKRNREYPIGGSCCWEALRRTTQEANQARSQLQRFLKRNKSDASIARSPATRVTNGNHTTTEEQALARGVSIPRTITTAIPKKRALSPPAKPLVASETTLGRTASTPATTTPAVTPPLAAAAAVLSQRKASLTAGVMAGSIGMSSGARLAQYLLQQRPFVPWGEHNSGSLGDTERYLLHALQSSGQTDSELVWQLMIHHPSSKPLLPIALSVCTEARWHLRRGLCKKPSHEDSSVHDGEDRMDIDESNTGKDRSEPSKPDSVDHVDESLLLCSTRIELMDGTEKLPLDDVAASLLNPLWTPAIPISTVSTTTAETAIASSVSSSLGNHGTVRPPSIPSSLFHPILCQDWMTLVDWYRRDTYLFFLVLWFDGNHDGLLEYWCATTLQPRRFLSLWESFLDHELNGYGAVATTSAAPHKYGDNTKGGAGNGLANHKKGGRNHDGRQHPTRRRVPFSPSPDSPDNTNSDKETGSSLHSSSPSPSPLQHDNCQMAPIDSNEQHTDDHDGDKNDGPSNDCQDDNKAGHDKQGEEQHRLSVPIVSRSVFAAMLACATSWSCGLTKTMNARSLETMVCVLLDWMESALLRPNLPLDCWALLLDIVRFAGAYCIDTDTLLLWRRRYVWDTVCSDNDDSVASGDKYSRAGITVMVQCFTLVCHDYEDTCEEHPQEERSVLLRCIWRQCVVFFDKVLRVVQQERTLSEQQQKQQQVLTFRSLFEDELEHDFLGCLNFLLIVYLKDGENDGENDSVHADDIETDDELVAMVRMQLDELDMDLEELQDGP